MELVNRKELKQKAKAAMKLAHPSFWVVALVYLLLTSGVSSLINLLVPADNTAGLFASILYMMYSMVITFGMVLWSIWIYRRLDPDLWSLTQGFSVTWKIIGLYANLYLRVICWTMALSLAASVFLAPLAMLLGTVGILLSAALVGVAAWFISLRYAFAPFLMADHPDAGPIPAIRNSTMLMRSWTKPYAKLELSFLGWQVLNALLTAAVLLLMLNTAGISLDLTTMEGVQRAYVTLMNSPVVTLIMALVPLPINLFLIPYQNVCRAGFYEKRLEFQRSAAANMPPL